VQLDGADTEVGATKVDGHVQTLHSQSASRATKQVS
jgi:hypothetical protein